MLFVDEPDRQTGLGADGPHVRAPDRLAGGAARRARRFGRRGARCARRCAIVMFFRLGVRNAARRRGRSLLIVVGLMLATTIIAAALGTGDTMGRTVRSTVLRTLGPGRRVDHCQDARSRDRRTRSVRARARTSSTSGSSPTSIVRCAAPGSSTGSHRRSSTPSRSRTRRRARPSLASACSPLIRPGSAASARSPVAAGGRCRSTRSRARAPCTSTAKAADKLHARAGDHIVALVAGRVLPLRVADVVDARGTGTDGGAMLMPLGGRATRARRRRQDQADPRLEPGRRRRPASRAPTPSFGACARRWPLRASRPSR